jgi:hypothetical protein
LRLVAAAAIRCADRGAGDGGYASEHAERHEAAAAIDVGGAASSAAMSVG